MKNKKIVAWVLIIVGLFSFLWLTGKHRTITQKSNKVIEAENQSLSMENGLVVSETLYDFGTISMRDGNVSKIFKITNNTNEDMLFTSLITSCMCTDAYFIRQDGSKKGPFGMEGMGFMPKLNETIKAGHSVDIEVVYDPNAHGPAGVGMIDRFVELKNIKGDKLQLEIKANVTP